MILKMKVLALGASLILVQGCSEDLMNVTTNGKQYEDVMSRNTFLATKVEATIAKPANQVKVQLAKLAADCIDGVGSVTTISSGAGASFQSGSVSRSYSARITNEGDADRLLVLLAPAGATPTVVMSTKILPQADGSTRLATLHSKTFSLFHDAAVHWANGSQTGCPQFK